VPRLVEALTGKRVIGAVAGGNHTAVWIEAGELFPFGLGGGPPTAPLRRSGKEWANGPTTVVRK